MMIMSDECCIFLSVAFDSIAWCLVRLGILLDVG